MKVLISADMEGTCGVVSWVHVMPPEYGREPSNQSEYDRARLRMTREVNAAIEGALAGGADEVIVNDSHNGMRNLIPEELQTGSFGQALRRHTSLLRGSPGVRIGRQKEVVCLPLEGRVA